MTDNNNPAPTPADLPRPGQQQAADPAPEEAPAAATPPTTADGEASGDGYDKALKAERAARRAAEKKAADLETRVQQYDERRSQVEKLTAEAEQARTEAEQARAELLRLRVAAETGLPADLHEFLPRGDEDTLRAQAEKLLAATAGRGRPAPDPSQGAKPNGAVAQLTRADLARMSPTEIETARLEGRLAALLG